MAVLLEHLAQGQHRRGPAGTETFEDGVPFDIPGGVETGIGHPDPQDTAGGEDAPAVTEHGEPVRHGQMLEHVLQEDGSSAGSSEGQRSAEVPGHVGLGSDQVEVDPAVEVVAPRTQVEAQGATPLVLAGLSAGHGGQGIGRHLLASQAHRRPEERTKGVGERQRGRAGSEALVFAHAEVLGQAHRRSFADLVTHSVIGASHGGERAYSWLSPGLLAASVQPAMPFARGR